MEALKPACGNRGQAVYKFRAKTDVLSSFYIYTHISAAYPQLCSQHLGCTILATSYSCIAHLVLWIGCEQMVDKEVAVDRLCSRTV